MTSDRRQLLVCGFVKRIEQKFKIMNVPKEIHDIIYLYQKFYDEWSRKYSHHDIEINQKEGMITVNTPNDASAYGTTIVSEGIFIWRVKIVLFDYDVYGGIPYIGIIKNDQYGNDEEMRAIVLQSDGIDWDKYGCQYCGGSGGLFAENAESVIHNPCKWRMEGDILEMTLDLNEKTLSFKVNNDDFGEFKNIEQGEYRLAFSVYKSSGSQFVLLQ